jgi:hypothetical protein
MSPEELRRLARHDARAFGEPDLPATPKETLRRPCKPILAEAVRPAEEHMTLEALQQGLAFVAGDRQGLEAAHCQLAGVLRFLRENNTDAEAVAPLLELAEALADLRGGNAAALLTTQQRKTEHKGPRALPERRETLVALLVEACMTAWPPYTRKREWEALKHVTDALKGAGITRPASSGRANYYDAHALEHWRRRAMKREDWHERIAELQRDGRWPSGPGDKAAAEALLASMLPMLAAELAND